jgi:2-polyprenyl-3-methyl-5-hydroxy-6-metoxy-1,4-benzoquinol methylase
MTTDAPGAGEIGRYYQHQAYISHSDTNKGIINQLYKRVRSLSVKRKFALLKGRTSANRLLDYGCGTGYFLNYCNSKGIHSFGLEQDENARTAASGQGAVVVDPQYRQELGSEKFDAITLWHVLEHIHNLNQEVQWLKRNLTDQGRVFIAVPNRESHDALTYREFWAAYDVPRHLYHFRKQDMVTLLGNHGFTVEEIIPMNFDAYYVSMLSEQYKGGNKLKGVFKGWLSNRKSGKTNRSSLIYVAKHA